MADIFISYASDDRPRVEPLVKALEVQGWSIFWDRAIPVRKSWRDVIQSELEAAKCAVVIWTENSINSKWVLAEVIEAYEKDILTQVLFVNVTIPFPYKQEHAADLTDWKGETGHPGFTVLLSAISEVVGPPSPKDKNERVLEDSESNLEKQLEVQPEEKEPPQPDHSKGKAVKEPPPFSSSKPPRQEWLSFGIVAVAIGVIVILSVISWLFSQRHKELTKLESKGKLEEASPPIDTAKKPEKTNSPLPNPYKNRIGMEFVLIPAGVFTMGSNPGVGKAEERPSHTVKISRPFYLQKTEVTQRQWEEVMGHKRSTNRKCGDDCPVEGVLWKDTHNFINELNEIEGGEAYRLPTEAEWEYAARAGTKTLFSFGVNEDELADYAWFSSNSDSNTHPTGTKKSNPWGLYDMHGNVWEWVEDDWHDSYDGAPDDGRAWVDEPRGATRVMRGGCWYVPAKHCRTAYRAKNSSDYRRADLGFRLARSVALGTY